MGMVGPRAADAYSIRKGSYSKLGKDEEVLEEVVFAT